MLIDQVFLYFLIAAGVIVSLPALWLLMRARWPERVEKLREISSRSIALSFVAGLPLLPFLFWMGSLLGKFGKKGDIPLVFALGFLALIVAIVSLAGMAGLATLVGERLTSTANAAEPWRTTLRGSIILVCLVSMPYVGWFALLPICIITGAGMMLRSCFVKQKSLAASLLEPQPMVAPSPPALPPQVPAQVA